ncbi:DegT/DnrJ/EryC1/StrS aminotransferase family protein [Sphingomonas sp.]|uniref:DegT/DnrJ/EryC1/StrS family aminotransferase n=1 Tax=Sphingomonas sp. TaxID=28214 RepID=UPI00286D8F26|nr:DegT/DnrJ/EryC1/StrS aminotransferase family protein [Sphingomonas sp.]
MLGTPFAPWPSFSEEEVAAVAAVLRSGKVNYWTGDECRHFEREYAAWAGTAHAVSLANGTVALDVALKALGIGPGDEVVVTPRTFIASASCVVNAGATPVFADVDRDSGNISAATIAPVLTERTKAIIPVHLAGWPADMDPIMALARERGIKVIEDCAQAHGARYKGRSVGAIGDIGAWSFCQDKIMTTGGEGGMVTTDDAELWSRMWSFKDHGKSWTAVYEREHPPGYRWLHESFGTNWRMLEVQAAIGRIQLRRMTEWSAARAAHAAALRAALEPLAGADGPVRLPAFPSREAAGDGETVHAHYKFYCYVRAENLAPGWDRDRIVSEINAGGVPCFQGTCSEVYLEKAFEGSGFAPAQRLPAAIELGETSVMLLVHPTLTAEQVELAASVAARVFTKAAGRAARQ